MCDRCPELEDRVEQLLDELHDLRVAATRQAFIAEAMADHPSNRDWCPPRGIPRLTLVTP